MALTSAQLQELKKLIEERRAALQAEIDADMDKVRGDSVSDIEKAVGDPGDESVARLISDLDQADTTRDISELRALDAALARMAEGTYGVCSMCGRDIDYARLRANPAAERDIECQTQFEKTHATSGGSTL